MIIDTPTLQTKHNIKYYNIYKTSFHGISKLILC